MARKDRGALAARLLDSEFRRGATVAAAVADDYNTITLHTHRLGDCILGKLNIRKGKPRRNAGGMRERDLACRWFALALASVMREMGEMGDGKMICRIAAEAGVTLKELRAAHVPDYDLRELKRAGVK